MYENIMKLLNTKGVKIEEGLRTSEINRISKLYDIEFPPSLKIFLNMALPVSKGFYNWRDFSEGNVLFIKECMEYPFTSVKNMAKDIFWCAEWGEEPKDESVRTKEIHKKLENAPKLVPVYAHRYMPLLKLVEHPIMSIHGVDVIYYGKNLENYIEIEFGKKAHSSLEYSIIEYVPFWSDLM